MTSKIEQQRQHFNNISNRYKAARSGDNHRLLKELIWNEFLKDKHVLRSHGLRVLEPMCGFADGKTILEHHLDTKIDYTGFDYSDAVVATVNRDNPGVVVTCADVTVYQPEDVFDLIILLGGLHHVPDHAEAVVTRMTRCLRPGGHFINLEPTSGNPLFNWMRNRIYDRNSLFDEQTEQGFDHDAYISMFQSAGLKSVDLFYPGLLSYVLYYNPDAFPWLNVGGPNTVHRIFNAERRLFRTWLGRVMGFATLSLWEK